MNTQIPNRLRFPYGGFLWDGVRSSTMRNGRNLISVEGPLCKECKIKLSVNRFSKIATCISCKKKVDYLDFLGNDIVKEEATAYLEAKFDEDIPIISFDLNPTKIIKEDNEDENYWLQAKIIQKDGKKMAIVYLGEKIHGKQNKKDYSQLFVDIDDEQIRFDKGNKNPMKLVFSLVAAFENSSTIIKKNK